MRGLMAKPNGEIIEPPIIVELPRGPDRAASTSSRRTVPARVWPTPRCRPPTPGYLTRRLVDVAQDVVIIRAGSTAARPTRPHGALDLVEGVDARA
jgi:DNA-directed RNA polymerase subunit beta'